MKLTLRPVFDGRIRNPGPRCWWLAVVRPTARPRPVRNTRRPRVERSRAFFRSLSLLWTSCVCLIRLTYTLLSHRRTVSVFFFFWKIKCYVRSRKVRIVIFALLQIRRAATESCLRSPPNPTSVSPRRRHVRVHVVRSRTHNIIVSGKKYESTGGQK